MRDASYQIHARIARQGPRHVENPTINDIDLLKIGRHFRLDEETKLVVGRNKDENEIFFRTRRLLSILP